jgi:hypothetical protein
MNKAIVYIEEMDSVADVTFPAVPQVVSLLMYDDTARTKDKPRPPTGYPVVCVTVSSDRKNYMRFNDEKDSLWPSFCCDLPS